MSAKPQRPPVVLTKLRAILASFSGVTEGTHSGAIAFKAGRGMFATYRDLGDDSELVFALEPDHMDALLAADPRFTRYPRAPAVVVRGSAIGDWSHLTDLLHESYRLVATKRAPKPRELSTKPRKRR